MTKPFTVNLAATLKSFEELNPETGYWASPKYDGIRFYVTDDGIPKSRSNKPIRNQQLIDFFAKNKDVIQWVDGEIIVGPPNASDVYLQTASFANSKSKTSDDVRLFLFDCLKDDLKGGPFIERVRYNEGVSTKMLERLIPESPISVSCVSQVYLGVDEIPEYERTILEIGYEGIMLRHPDRPYKSGRSTMKEQGLMKVKRFEDTEGLIVGFVERMENTNEKVVNELGRSSRSSAKAGKIPTGMLGAFVVSHPDWEETFEIGTGFNHALAKEVWDNQQNYINTLVKFKHFAIGAKDRPRHPVFLGFRDTDDI